MPHGPLGDDATVERPAPAQARRFKTYPAYKDSGVEWLGEIPMHWRIAPLFTAARERDLRNIRNQETNVLSLSYGRIIRRNILDNFGLMPESFDTYQIVIPGSIVLRLTDLQNDKRSLRVGLVEEPGIITSAYVALDVVGRVSPLFGFYLLYAYDVTKVFYTLGGGVRQTMKFDDLKWMPILIPEDDEQRAIASFLDRETARIDALLAKKERLIELLQEKRTALITRAVTKGLDPNVPMKDSGVEWLGEIPVHWKIARLKHAARRIVDCPHETPTYSDEGEHFVIRTADVSEGRLDLANARRVDDIEYRRRVRRLSLLPGDIVYSREGERFGFAATVPPAVSACLGQRMMQFQAGAGWWPRFLMWQLNARHVYQQASVDTTGATSPHVNVDTIRGFLLSEPPLAEQKAIAEFVDREAREFDQLLAGIRSAIDRLTELRTALVSAAVTGKIDVRQEANRTSSVPA